MNDSTVEATIKAVQELFATFYLEELTDDELASMLCLVARIKARIETAPKGVRSASVLQLVGPPKQNAPA